MASVNVDKALKALKDNPTLALELSRALVNIEAGAGVKMTKAEKKEFMQELSNSFSQETISVTWSS